jgi:dihydrolipoamide dehydrogenase
VTSEYDVVIVGAGTGGYVAAIRAAQLGQRTAVVEQQGALGGTCLHRGCIPTKALLEHAHAFKIVQDAKTWGITLGEAVVSIDMKQVQARKNRIIKNLSKGLEFLFKKNKIEWIRGCGRLLAPGRLEVNDNGQSKIISAREIVLATGSTPRTVPGIEIDHQRIITSDQAMMLDHAPPSMIILGSGAVGVEFASIFRRFGVDVTLIEVMDRLVPLEDVAVSKELERSFRKQGIRILTDTKVTAAMSEADHVRVEATGPKGQVEHFEAAYLLVATGRGPVTNNLVADDVDLKLEHGFIRVDELYRTSVQGVSAVGDVITLGWPGHPQLAHLSSAEGILVAERIAGRKVTPLNYGHVPSCVYCEPEIGSVGLTEEAAIQRGHRVRVGTFPFGVLGRAKISGDTDGFVKIVSDEQDDKILGLHLIGPRATELIAEAALALRMECTSLDLGRTIHAHPTLSEAIAEAAHATHGDAIHA